MPGKASYTKRQDHEATVFETKPAPCPKWWFALILGALMAVVAVSSGQGGVAGLVMWGIAIVAIAAFIVDPRPGGMRAPAKLRVTADELVTTSGLNFSNEDIGNIQLDNLYDEGGTGAGVGVIDRGVKRKQELRTVSWLLRLNPANRTPSINIACGMDQDTAANLLKDISKIMSDTSLR